MTSAEPLLSICGAEKRYGGRTVLRIDNFGIADGDRILLVGQNGSGKSTLLRVLAGATTLTTGKINRSPPMRDLKIGYVPQSGGMYGDMTLRENLEIYCGLFGLPWAEARLSSLHFWPALEPVQDLPIAQLSGGTQKLAMLACILAIEPDALLLDEPASELDGHHAVELYSLLANLCTTLRFIVVSTHDVRGLVFLHRTLELSNGSFL
jgi:ABC-type multidrug transport system ATPase subunit